MLTHGRLPVVDGVVTSFDSIDKVKLAKYGLAPLITACKKSGTCTKLREALPCSERQVRRHGWTTAGEVIGARRPAATEIMSCVQRALRIGPNTEFESTSTHLASPYKVSAGPKRLAV